MGFHVNVKNTVHINPLDAGETKRLFDALSGGKNTWPDICFRAIMVALPINMVCSGW
jgi:hypothetical protein